MYKLLISTALTLSVGSAAFAVNLIDNGNFDDGGNGWNAWAGGTYYYPDNGDTIASFGWWDGANIYRELNSYFEANTVYTMTAVARNGDGGCRGITMGLQDATNGWSSVYKETFKFPDADKGITGPWRTYTMTLDTRDPQFAGIVGHKIAVAFAEYATTDWSQYPWLHLNTVSLEAQAVPEPVSMVALGLGALAVVARKRRKA